MTDIERKSDLGARPFVKILQDCKSLSASPSIHLRKNNNVKYLNQRTGLCCGANAQAFGTWKDRIERSAPESVHVRRASLLTCGGWGGMS